MAAKKIWESPLSGLVAPVVATVTFLLAWRHLWASQPATWRGGAPIAPWAIFLMIVLCFVLPIWVSRKEQVTFPFRTTREAAQKIQRVVIVASEILLLVAALMAAYGQAKLLGN